MLTPADDIGLYAIAPAGAALLASCRAQLACAEPIHQEVKHEACHG
ncbi:MAG TPA: hypothetical protein PLX84_14460 [Acidiphilium sp.]|nr:hypothetical protein [Acidiphilium sp.]